MRWEEREGIQVQPCLTIHATSSVAQADSLASEPRFVSV